MTQKKKSAKSRKKVTGKARRKPAVSSTTKKPKIVKSSNAAKTAPQSTTPIHNILTWLATPTTKRRFMYGSVAVLALTTIFWALLSARLHQANADQLIDTYLFESIQTFQQANFPGAHSFLLKWPIFAVMQLYGASPAVFIGTTVIMTLLTVGALAYALYRIERRPVIFGLLCLALSSILLLIPAQPYPGALLPVNMAMTTTRNLEYIVFIVALCYGARLKSFKSWQFGLVVGLIALVIASDKLFAVLAIGGAASVALWYAVVKRRAMVFDSVRIVVAAIAGFFVSSLVLFLINHFSITNLINEQSSSPYPMIQSLSQLATGILFGVGGLLTNFGANPVHAVLVLRDIPAALLSSLSDISAISYVINILLFGAGVYAAVRTLISRASDTWSMVSVLLLSASLAAGLVYVLTDHYYPVDARYLSIALFAVAIAATTYLRRIVIRPIQAVVAAVVLLITIPIGLLTAWQEYQASDQAMGGRKQVTSRVSDELERRNIDHLAGDYWDVTPVKAETQQPVTIMPVSGCTAPRPVLNSGAWFDSSGKSSSAYLAVRDGSALAGPETANISPTNIDGSATYGGCSLAKVVGTYGVPSERVVISKSSDGRENRPDVLLLLYADGLKSPLEAAIQTAEATQAAAAVRQAPLKSVIPQFTSLTERDVCSRGITLQVVAHEDDDILFMNPDLMRTIKDGRCIRTVYLTAGDAGSDISYWGNREKGAQAAYAHMYGVENIWQSEQQLINDRSVLVTYLKDIPQVSLVFMRLPDGNLHGTGFEAHENGSAQKLIDGSITTIKAVDGSASYMKGDLVEALRQIITTDKPDQIRTQGSSNHADGDHSDHHAVGTLTTEAAAGYMESSQLARYIGYPIRQMPVNVSDDDITHKQATFLAYAKFDGAVCQSAFECQHMTTYGGYLTRQYVP